MRDVRTDNTIMQCWHCGGSNFHAKRTTRAHVIGFTTCGVGALLTHKKLKCLSCGKYNQVGNAKPLHHPQTAATVVVVNTPPVPASVPTGPPAGWYTTSPDSTCQRWWNGTAWTEHTTPGVAA